VVSFVPPPLYSQGKNPWYPLDRRMGGSQSRSGCSGEEKTSQLLPGLEPPIIWPVAQRYTTELSRLLIYGEEVGTKYEAPQCVKFFNILLLLPS
jgi:hypothetical protein